MFTIQLTQPDFTGPALPLPIRCSVENLTWQAVGGPDTARLRADARDLSQLWQLAERLRCGLTVTDGRGPAWWGYLAAVELHQAGQTVRLSLDEMSNQVSVSYRDFSGQKRVTAWLSDDQSIRRYGLKQRRVTLPDGWAGDAAAYASRLLAEDGRPRVVARSVAGADRAQSAAARAERTWASGDAPVGATRANALVGYANDETSRPYAILEGRGWWDTLGWTYYSEPRGRYGCERGGSQQAWGDGSPYQQVAWRFACPPGEPWTLSEVWVRLRRVRASDGLTLRLHGDAPGAPGLVLASSTITAAETGDEMRWVRFALDTPLIIAAQTVYWLALSRVGPQDPASYYTISIEDGPPADASPLYYWDGSQYQPRLPTANVTFQLFGVEETTEQLRRILSGSGGSGSAGQFLSGARIEQASEVSRSLYQDGALRARAVAEQLLKIGASAGDPYRLPARRHLARIEPDRTARVYAAPEKQTAQLRLGSGGQVLRADGRPLSPSEWPAGQWVRLPDLAEAVFVERCAWERGGMRIHP